MNAPSPQKVMLRHRTSLFLFFMLLAFGFTANAQDSSEPAPSIKENITLFTSDNVWKEQIKCRLNDIIFDYYGNETFASLWSRGTVDHWRYPCLEITFIANRYKLNKHYAPSLLSIQSIADDKLKVKVAFLFEGADEKNPEIFAIYNFMLKKENQGLYFFPFIDYATEHWTSNKIDGINYRYKPSHRFDKLMAQKSSNFNLELASFFETEPISFDYYITENSEELNRILGFDLNPYMFARNQYSGYAQPTNKKIFSGNSSEWYPHEMIHLYTQQKLNNSNNNLSPIFDEGLATWLGGSVDKDLAWHVQVLKSQLNERKIDLNNFAQKNIAISDTSNLHYIVGGMLVEQAYKMYGKEKLWALVDNSNSEELVYKNICKVFGVKREEVGKLILELMDKY